jgi:hypothetical protein
LPPLSRHRDRSRAWTPDSPGWPRVTRCSTFA